MQQHKNNKGKFTLFSLNFQGVRRIGSLIGDAISGKETDFTTIDYRKAILLLSIPMVLEMLMESLFAIVDIFFVSKLGSDAVSAVGLTESLTTLIYALGIGISVAATALVSRRAGEKRLFAASIISFQVLFATVLAAIPLATTGIVFPGEMLSLMGAEQHIAENLSAYTAITIASAPVIMILFAANAIFRSSGNPVTAMKVLFVANGLNMILDPIFIFGWGPIPAMGLEGAAIATVTGQSIAVLWQLWILFNGKNLIRITTRAIRIHWKTIGKIYRLALGVTGQHLIGTASWIGLMRIMAEFGSVELAGYTIAIRIVVFFFLPAVGISNAAATMVGQNLGAKNPERAEKAAWFAAWLNMGLLGAAGLAMWIFPTDIIEMFSTENDVISSGAWGLRLVSYGMLFYGLGMVMLNAINAAGDTLRPTWFSILAFWIIELPLAYLLAMETSLAASGVYVSILVAESALAILAWWWFSKGNWKKIKL